MIRKIWNAAFGPLLSRPPRYQVAALCWRRTAQGAREVLIVTSLDTGRWILPKGWPIAGHDAAGTAEEEAWEEAGVKPRPRASRSIGRYRYDKVNKAGIPMKTDVEVIEVEVLRLFDDYPEASRRRRRWVSPAEAAEAVQEPELKALLRALPPPPAAPEQPRKGGAAG